MRSSWIIWLDPKSDDKRLHEKRARLRQRRLWRCRQRAEPQAKGPPGPRKPPEAMKDSSLKPLEGGWLC